MLIRAISKFINQVRGLNREITRQGKAIPEITVDADLEACMLESNDHPVLIFKHSTACPVSGRANIRIGDYLESKGDAAPDLRVVKVIETRTISNAIAERLNIEHQSPQIILVVDGHGLWNTSHGDITVENIETAIAEHG